MNIFKDYKTSKHFIEMIDEMEEERKTKFSKLVKERFYQKVTSDEELENFYITIDDLDSLLIHFNENNN